MTKKSEKPQLTPPDLKRCQCFITAGFSFMQIGGRPHEPRQCTNKPDWLVEEIEPGPDGQCGSMTVCNECRAVLEKKQPTGLRYQEIPVPKPNVTVTLTWEEAELVSMAVTRQSVMRKHRNSALAKINAALTTAEMADG